MSVGPMAPFWVTVYINSYVLKASFQVNGSFLAPLAAVENVSEQVVHGFFSVQAAVKREAEIRRAKCLWKWRVRCCVIAVLVQQGQRRLVEGNARSVATELGSSARLDHDVHQTWRGQRDRPLLDAAESVQRNGNADWQAAVVSVVTFYDFASLATWTVGSICWTLRW